MRVVFDSNLLIDYLNGIEAAKREINHTYSRKVISRITWMEVMVGVPPEHQQVVIQFLNRFDVIDTSPAIGALAVSIRQAQRIRLPDAIIWATAIDQEALLVTRNTRDFPAQDPGIRIPYTL